MSQTKSVSFGEVMSFPNNKDEKSFKGRFNYGSLRSSLRINGSLIAIRLVSSKLRKREDSSVTVNNNTINNNSTANNTTTVIQQQPQQQEAVETRTPAVVPTEPPPFFWRYSNSSQFSLSTNDQSNLVPNIISSEEISECKGFRKNLRGKWRRLVKKKAPTEVYAIPAEFQDQLKQIYVY